MVILTLLMLLLLGAAFYIKREHTAKHQKMQEQEELHRDKEEDQQIKEEALKVRGKAGQGPRQTSEASTEDKGTAGPLASSEGLKRTRENRWGCGGSRGLELDLLGYGEILL